MSERSSKGKKRKGKEADGEKRAKKARNPSSSKKKSVKKAEDYVEDTYSAVRHSTSPPISLQIQHKVIELAEIFIFCPRCPFIAQEALKM